MCQLGWAQASRYVVRHGPGVSVPVVMNEMNIYVSGLRVKQMALRNVGEPHRILKTWTEKGGPGPRSRGFWEQVAFGLERQVCPAELWTADLDSPAFLTA